MWSCSTGVYMHVIICLHDTEIIFVFLSLCLCFCLCLSLCLSFSQHTFSSNRFATERARWLFFSKFPRPGYALSGRRGEWDGEVKSAMFVWEKCRLIFSVKRSELWRLVFLLLFFLLPLNEEKEREREKGINTVLHFKSYRFPLLSSLSALRVQANWQVCIEWSSSTRFEWRALRADSMK